MSVIKVWLTDIRYTVAFCCDWWAMQKMLTVSIQRYDSRTGESFLTELLTLWNNLPNSADFSTWSNFNTSDYLLK